MFDNFTNYLLLFVVGNLCGFINSMSGGGSILTLPALLFCGLDSTLALSTNRIALLMQNSTAVWRYYRHGKLHFDQRILIVIPAVLGALIGLYVFSGFDAKSFDKILATVMVGVIALMFIPAKSAARLRHHIPGWVAYVIFIFIGFYGGFVQVGVGFILLAALSMVRNYDLVEANAVKVFIVLSYIVFMIPILIIKKMIVWEYAIPLSIGNMLGADIGVRLAVKKGNKFIKYVVIGAILISVAKLGGLFDMLLS